MVDQPADGVYPEYWEADVVLRDGGTAHLRPIHPSDADAVQAFHAGQSQKSIYMRFFAFKARLSSKELKRFTEVDYQDRVALVITIGGEIMGIGRYDRLDDPAEAEVAFNIADAHQGRGIGSILLEHLAAAARENGIRRFSAEVLPGEPQDAHGLLRRRLRRQTPFRRRRGQPGVQHRPHRQIPGRDGVPRAPRGGAQHPGPAGAVVGGRHRGQPQVGHRGLPAAGAHHRRRLHRPGLRHQPRGPGTRRDAVLRQALRGPRPGAARHHRRALRRGPQGGGRMRGRRREGDRGGHRRVRRRRRTRPGPAAGAGAAGAGQRHARDRPGIAGHDEHQPGRCRSTPRWRPPGPPRRTGAVQPVRGDRGGAVRSVQPAPRRASPPSSRPATGPTSPATT